MIVDFSQLSPAQAYFGLIQTVIPRPIAWVLSDSGNGKYNLAPFSFFNAVCGEPPLVMISIGRKPDGVRKDTWVNIDDRRYFIVHTVSADQGQAMVNTSSTLAHGDSELEAFNLTTVPVEGWPLPRVAGPKIAMLCEKFAIHELGPEPQGLILGRVLGVYFHDDVATISDERLLVDAAKVAPLGRLGGNDYVTFGEVITMKRPK